MVCLHLVFAAVGHPRNESYVFTEKDWCGDNVEAYKGRWSEEQIPLNRDRLRMAKANTEKLIYEEAATDGSFEAMAILPLHVIGPLLAINNDQPWAGRHIKRMMQGSRTKAGEMEECCGTALTSETWQEHTAYVLRQIEVLIQLYFISIGQRR